MQLLLDFIGSNWRLIYSLYRGTPESAGNILGGFHLEGSEKGFSCVFITPLWIDLFCERETQAEVCAETDFRPGHLYDVEGYSHRFAFVYVDEATVIYTDYYSEARGVDGFRASLMSAEEMRRVLSVMRSGNCDEVAKFHGADRDSLDYPGETFRDGYIWKVLEYPIVNPAPTLQTLLDVCRTKDLAQEYSTELWDGWRSGEPEQTPEYHDKWASAFTLLACKAHEAIYQ